jgi:hypothetical protein
MFAPGQVHYRNAFVRMSSSSSASEADDVRREIKEQRNLQDASIPIADQEIAVDL